MIHRIIELVSISAVWILLFGCVHNAQKVNIDYRRAPIVDNIEEKQIAFWKILQHDTTFDASRDLELVFRKEIKLIEQLKAFNPLPEDSLTFSVEKEAIEDHLQKQITEFDWNKWNETINADLLILGEVYYEANDFSGYDSEWKINRYGYRVPSKVWKDRTSYKFKLTLFLVDLREGRLLLEKTYDADETTEGSADEVGVFYDLAQKKIRVFLDYIIGKKVNAYRYLMTE